ncbi:8547_t:CDS:2, partial [Cetraspora pellucida]
MLKAGSKPSMVYEAIRSKDGTPTATRKDISNLSTQINFLEETMSIAVLINSMEERGRIKHLFFCYKESIKNTKCFSEVILIDATYKTNVYKLLFVNFVGISNLGINRLHTFGITGAWILDESEKSYVWIIEHLASLIFSDIFPSVFVTDNDLVLIGALGKIFPKSEHLLCTWHIMNNFKKNLKKHFSDISFDEVVKIIDNFIYSRDYDALNATIITYKKLALSSSNE